MVAMMTNKKSISSSSSSLSSCYHFHHVSVWDKDPEKSEFIGQVIERFNRIEKMPAGTDLQW